MIDSKSDGSEAKVPGGESRWMQRGILGAVCLLVIGVYIATARSGFLESPRLNGAESYYNLLVQGFRAGHLSVNKEVPPALAQLEDPYDSNTRALRRSASESMLDLSYYKGRLYLYFGITPALILFWPYVTLTGHYLLHKQAVEIFCALGFLASAGLLGALWRRYFAEVSVGVVAACTLALGLATGLPMILSQADVHEVAISCGYMLTMLALVAIWCALHEPEWQCGWLAAASVAYGLAVGARPSLVFGAIILLVPVIHAWRASTERDSRRPVWTLLMAAVVPIAAIVCGLMLYNARRFDNPFEFGLRYQLTAERLVTKRLFSLHYMWFNFRVVFLEPARWSSRFPFVRDIALPPIPTGHGGIEHPFGILTSVPVVWSALAVPLAWRRRSTEARSLLHAILGAVTLLFVICASTNCLFTASNFRYEVEYLPAFVLLAVAGVLGLERALTDRPGWRYVARCGWGLLLSFSVAFNLLACVEKYAEAHNNRGIGLLKSGKVAEAIGQFEQAMRLKPDDAEAQNNWGLALHESGKVSEAIAHFEQALRINPDYADAHNNCGAALLESGKVAEAIAHCEQAVRLKPEYAEAHYNLGNALFESGKVAEAIGQFEQALQIKPDLAEAHINWGIVLLGSGEVSEAIAHFEQALRLKPDDARAHCALGKALFGSGKVAEAIAQFEQALRLKPDYADAYHNLELALRQQGSTQPTVGHSE